MQLAHELPGYQEARNDEEDINADVSSREAPRPKVKNDNEQYRDCSQALNVTKKVVGLERLHLVFDPQLVVCAEVLPENVSDPNQHRQTKA